MLLNSSRTEAQDPLYLDYHIPYKLVNVSISLSSVSHSSKLVKAEESSIGSKSAQVITWASALATDVWRRVPGEWWWRGGVVLEWALNRWDLKLPPGRQCQNWAKLQDTQLLSQRFTWCGDKLPHLPQTSTCLVTRNEVFHVKIKETHSWEELIFFLP